MLFNQHRYANEYLGHMRNYIGWPDKIIITLVELDQLLQNYLLKPPPRESPLANFNVLAINGAVLGFFGADAAFSVLDLEFSLAALLEARVGSINDGRPRLESEFEGALKAVPFLSCFILISLGGLAPPLLSHNLVERLSVFNFL